MSDFLKKKGADFYLMLVAALASVVCGVLVLLWGGFATAATVTVQIPILLFIGAAVFIVSVWFDLDFMPVLEGAFYVLAFAFILSYSINVIVDQINAIQNSGGDFASCLTYLILSVGSILLTIVACFCKKQRG